MQLKCDTLNCANAAKNLIFGMVSDKKLIVCNECARNIKADLNKPIGKVKLPIQVGCEHGCIKYTGVCSACLHIFCACVDKLICPCNTDAYIIRNKCHYKHTGIDCHEPPKTIHASTNKPSDVYEYDNNFYNNNIRYLLVCEAHHTKRDTKTFDIIYVFLSYRDEFIDITHDILLLIYQYLPLHTLSQIILRRGIFEASEAIITEVNKLERLFWQHVKIFADIIVFCSNNIPNSIKTIFIAAGLNKCRHEFHELKVESTYLSHIISPSSLCTKDLLYTFTYKELILISAPKQYIPTHVKLHEYIELEAYLADLGHQIKIDTYRRLCMAIYFGREITSVDLVNAIGPNKICGLFTYIWQHNSSYRPILGQLNNHHKQKALLKLFNDTSLNKKELNRAMYSYMST
jgi:hypothetical protein